MLSLSVSAVSPAEAQSYVTARGLSGWPAALGDQTAALRRGQDYLAREYNHRWLVSFTDATAPETVKFAIVEAALAEARSPGSLSPVASAATAKVLTEVKGIKWTPLVSSSSSDPGDLMKPVLTHVEAMLASLASSKSRAAFMVI